MYLITDGLEYSATETKEGTLVMQKNGVPAIYEDGVMKLADRSCIAGSVATTDRLVRNMYKRVRSTALRRGKNGLSYSGKGNRQQQKVK